MERHRKGTETEGREREKGGELGESASRL